MLNNLPDKFILQQNFPNPFNPSTKIRYTVPSGSFEQIRIEVYDILGNKVITLVNEEKPAGTYEINFDGGELSSGVYYYKMISSNNTDVKKMLLLK
jgi:hypothetical protein